MSFSVFGISIYPYGICCALAAFVILLGLCKQYACCGKAGRFTVLLILCGGIGARLLYCLVNIRDYTEGFGSLWLTLRFFDGGFSMTGLLIGFVCACLWQSKLGKESFSKTLDRLAVPLPLAILFLRAGECFSDLGIGKIVRPNGLTQSIPWFFLQSRMGKAVEYRLNVRVYEAIAALLIFLVILWRAKELMAYEGRTGALFFILYGGTQIFLESLRDDGHMKIIFLRIAQVGAAAMLLLAFDAMRKKACAVDSMGAWGSALRWLVMLLGLSLAVAVEFSLDGRLTVGKPTAMRDYIVLGAVCVALMTVALRTLTDSCQRLLKEEKG